MKKKLLLLLFILTISPFIWAQNVGSSFSNPVVVSSLPLLETNMTTCGFSNNYSISDIGCIGNFLSGNEKIYSFTPVSGLPNVQVSMTNIDGNFSGLYVVDDTLSSGVCLGSVGNPSNTDRVISNLALVGGRTYYIVISTWAEPRCIPSFDLQILDQTCPAPTNVFVSNTVHNSIDINWTEYGSATQWEIEYGPIAYTLGQGTKISTGTNPASISGLTAQSEYDVYVRAICNGSETSYWVGPLTFKTSCLPLTDFVENFNSFPSNITPDCWATGVWGVSNFGSVTTYQYTSPNSGNRHIRMTNGSNTNADLYLIYPALSNLGAGTHRTRFYAKDTYGNTLVIGTMTDPYDSATFSALDTFLLTSNYVEYTFDFASYSGTDNFIALKRTSTSSNQSTYVDDVVWEQTPACVRPTLLNATASPNSANLQWVENGSAIQWEIEYGPSGFSLGTGTSVSASSNPFQINGLTVATSYEFYVRSDCGTAGSSVWEGPFTFLTPCVSVSAPYFEDVEAHNATTNSNISNCWNSIPNLTTSLLRWNVDASGSTPTSSTGPSGAYSGTKYFYLESSQGKPEDIAELYSELVDVSSLVLPRIQFMYHMYGTYTNKLVIDVLHNGVWINGVDSIVGQQQQSNVEAWKQKNIYLSGYTGDVQIRFRGFRGTSGTGDISLDDIQINESPACIEPTLLLAQNETSTSVDLSWFSTAANFQIEYDLSGFQVGNGVNTTVTSTSPFTVTGLNSASTYDFYVRSLCGTDTSIWQGPISATTLCGTVNLPYAQNFDTWPLNCWDMTGGTDNWVHNSGHARAGFWNMMIGNDAYMTTMDILVDADAQIKFDWSHLAAPNVLYDSLRVDVSIASSGVWTPVWGRAGADLNSNDGATNSQPGFFITEIIALDPATYTNQTIKVRLYAHSGYGPNLYVDNFMVEEVPSCPAPNYLTVSHIAAASVDLNWVEQGTATEWQVKYAASGATVYTKALASSSTIAITGLTAQTDYSFYVRSICGTSDSSAWVGPFDFQTGCAALSSFTEDFIGVATPDLPLCWNNTVVTNVTNAYVRSYSSGSPHSGNRHIRMYNGSDVSADLYLISPALSTISTASHRLKFWTKSRYKNNYVIVGTMSDPDDVNTFTPFDTVIIGLDYVEHKVNFDTYTGNDGHIAFKTIHDRTFDYTYIDDVEWELMPSCLEVSDLNAFAQPTSANLSWVEHGSASAWEVEYGTPGFIQGTGTSIAANSNPFNLSGLSVSTEYSYYVRAVCGPSDSSVWEGPFEFKTHCNYFVAPFLEDVESHNGTTNSNIENCWTSSPRLITNKLRWNVSSSGTTPTSSTGPSSALSGTKMFYLEANNGLTGDFAELYSPLIDLSALTIPRLQFGYHMYGVNMGDLWVDVHDGTQWVLGVDSIIGEQQTDAGDAWEVKNIYLVGYSDTIQIRFRGTRGNGLRGDMAVDNIAINEAPSCIEPGLGIATDLSTNSTTLSWLNHVPATNWELEYGLAPYSLGSSSSHISNTDSLSISGLNSDSDYEFYVRSLCGVGDTSIWSGPFSFKTLCDVYSLPFFENVETHNTKTSGAMEHCWNSQPNGVAGDYRWNVFGPGSYPSWSTGPSMAHSGGRFFYVNAATRIENKIAELYTPEIDVTGSTLPIIEFYYHMFGADIGTLLIDVYHNGSWVNGVGSISGQQQTLQTDDWKMKIISLSGYTGNIQVRFRAISVSGGLGNIAIDDISVKEANSNDLSIVSITLANDVCGLGTDSLIATVVNNGKVGQSGFSVGYTFNGTTITPEVVNEYIGPFDTLIYTFNTLVNFSTPGLEDIEVYTLLSNDENTSNDTLVTQVGKTYLVNSFPYHEDFEAGQGGWIIDNGAEGTWAFGTPNKTTISGAASGNNAFVVGGLNGDYTINENSIVNSPCFDFSNLVKPFVQMNVWWENDFYGDGANLQYSIDGGQTWLVVGDVETGNNWYTNADIYGLNYQSGWTGNNGMGSNGWVLATHDVAFLAGQSDVKFRVVFGSDDWMEDDGFAFDDFSIFEGITVSEDIVLCTDDTLTLNPGDFDGYLWNENFSLPEFFLDAGVLNEGLDTLEVIVSAVGGYKMYDTIIVLVEKPVVNLGTDTVLCFGTTLILDAGSDFASYAWNDNSVDQTLVTDGSTSGAFHYSVIATTVNNCSTVGEINVNVNTEVMVDLGPDIVFSDSNTQGSSLVLDAGPGFAGYLWNNGSTAQTIMVDSYTDGEISVIVTNMSGCEGADTIMVDFRLSTGEVLNGSLKMYPNPATDWLIIELSDLGGARDIEIKIIDVSGRTVINRTLDASSNSLNETFDVSRLVTGTYFVEFELNGKIVTQQFMIQ